MIAGTKTALFVLLAVTIGACSGGNSSSTSTAPDSARVAVTDSPPAPQPSSIPATEQTVPQPDSPTASVAGVSTTQVVPTIPTSPSGVGGTSVPAETTTTPSTPASAGAVALIDKDCVAERADGRYDLLHVKVESLVSRYRLIAQYSGDTFQHDILISFDLGASSYLVNAELFEDGKGVARVADAGSSDSLFLDPPQTITSGLVDLSVRNDQIRGISGTPFEITVLLKVDGSEIETCQ